MALLDDVYTRLSNQAVFGGVTGWVCYIGYMPEDQDKCIQLVDTGGGPGQVHGSSDVGEATFQVTVRSSAQDYAGCQTKWRAVFTALENSEASLGAGYHQVQAMQSSPLFLGLDQNKRPLMVINFRVMWGW